MAADLGTWPAEQATVLLEVLQAGGLHPDARRVRGEVHVTVPEEEGDKAHATLVANMDRIAQAARPAKPKPPSGKGGRKLRAIDGGAQGKTGRSEPGGKAPKKRPSGDRSAGSARRARGGGDPARSTAAVIAVVGFGTAFAAALAGGSPAFPLVLMTGALVWVLGRRAERGS